MFAPLPASRRILLICTTAAILTACATPPDLGPAPQVSTPEQYETIQSFAAPVADWPSDQWWRTYNDPQLTALIEEALADSPTLQMAAARLRAAQAEAQQAGASRMPSVNAETSVSNSRQDLTADNLPDVIRDSIPDDWSTTASAGVSLSYQLDFFGRNRASFAAATSMAEAAEAEAASARLQLSTAVALAYAEFVRLNADRVALEDAARMRQASAVLLRQRVAAGLENEGQAHQATAELANARAELIAVNGAIAKVRNQLAALLGKGPDRGLDIELPRSLTIGAPGLPARVDLDLIGRRPDLVAARLTAEAAAERINVARADFYPNVNLTAIVGLQTLGLDRLGDGYTTFAQAGPAVSLPIFNGGRIQGAYRGARADYDEAVANYNYSLTNALREVADAIGDRQTLEAQLIEQGAALHAAEDSYRIARLRYEGGLASYIDTLSVESSLNDLERTIIKMTKDDPVCRRLMTMPGIGPLTALSFRAAIDDPTRFSHSRLVASYFGLTPRRHQSGQSLRGGRISKFGDDSVRALLYEAAVIMLVHSKTKTALKTWGLKLAARKGRKTAAVACARKMAVIMHRMWITGKNFDPAH